jgi:hypothetical protein
VATLAALANTMLAREAPSPRTQPGAANDLLEHLRNQLAGAEHVKWALVRTLNIWSLAAARRLHGETAPDVGRSLRHELEMWLCDAPVDDIWNGFGGAEAEIELDGLGSSIFRTAAARDGFARRVAAQAPRLAPVLANWILQAGGVGEERFSHDQGAA